MNVLQRVTSLESLGASQLKHRTLYAPARARLPFAANIEWREVCTGKLCNRTWNGVLSWWNNKSSHDGATQVEKSTNQQINKPHRSTKHIHIISTVDDAHHVRALCKYTMVRNTGVRTPIKRTTNQMKVLWRDCTAFVLGHRPRRRGCTTAIARRSCPLATKRGISAIERGIETLAWWVVAPLRAQNPVARMVKADTKMTTYRTTFPILGHIYWRSKDSLRATQAQSFVDWSGTDRAAYDNDHVDVRVAHEHEDDKDP